MRDGDLLRGGDLSRPPRSTESSRLRSRRLGDRDLLLRGEKDRDRDRWCLFLEKRGDLERDLLRTGDLERDLLRTGDLERDLLRTGDLERDLLRTGDLERDLLRTGDLERDLLRTGDLERDRLRGGDLERGFRGGDLERDLLHPREPRYLSLAGDWDLERRLLSRERDLER